MTLSASILSSLVLLATGADEGAAPAAPADAIRRTASSEPIALLPRAVTSFGASVHGGWLYVLGGYFGTPHDYHREHQSDAFTRMNLLDGSWETLPSPGAMQSVALVAHGEHLVRVGGMLIHNADGEPQALESTQEVARFDPLTKEWTALAPLPEPRSSHMAAVVGDHLYVAGGWRLAPEQDGIWTDSVLRLDLANEMATWESFPAPFQLRGLTVCATDSELIVIGGMGAKGGFSNAVHVFDPVNEAWRRGPEFPGSAFGVAATVSNDVVYASGKDGQVFAWSLEDDAWVALTSLAFPRFFHQIVAGDFGELLAVGGIGPGGRVRHVERIEIEPQAPGVRSTVWTLPAPGRAKNRQGVLLQGNALHVFGGNRSLEQHDFEPEDFLDEAYTLDLAKLSWSRLKPFPSRRQSFRFATAGDQGFAFAVGGFGHDGEVARTFAEVLRYDVEFDWWKTLQAPLPEARSQFGLVEHANELWIFGGLDYDPRREKAERFRHVTSVLHMTHVDDESAGFEATNIELPNARRAFGAAKLGARYYLVGGMRDGFERVEPCDVFDFEAGTWSEIPTPSATRISPELVALDGRLFLAGGSSDRDGAGLEPDPTVEMFDPATGVWTTVLDELPIAPRQLHMEAFGDRLLLYSAQQEGAAVQVALLDFSQVAKAPAVVEASATR